MNRASLTSPKLLAAAFFARVVVHASRPETVALSVAVEGDLLGIAFFDAAVDLELRVEDFFAEEMKREVAIAEIGIRDGWNGTPDDLVARAAVASLTLQEAASRPP